MTTPKQNRPATPKHKESYKMSVTDTDWNLPDPARHRAFYQDVLTKRLLAFIIDSILITLIAVLLVPLTGFTAVFYFGFLALIVSLIYRVVSMSRKSATPGMRLMGIELRNHQGQPLDGSTALFHTLIFTFAISTALPQMISIGMMLFTKRHQGLNDMLLGTVVINRSART